MKGAAIYKLSDGYIIHSNSKTVPGFWIASKPYIRLGNNSTIEEIINGLLLALKASNKGVNPPSNWSDFNKEFLKSIGVKSLKMLNKEGVKYCDVSSDGVTITFIPSKNSEPPEKGFSHKPNESVKISSKASIEEIGSALADAFSKCE